MLSLTPFHFFLSLIQWSIAATFDFPSSKAIKPNCTTGLSTIALALIIPCSVDWISLSCVSVIQSPSCIALFASYTLLIAHETTSITPSNDLHKPALYGCLENVYFMNSL